MSINWDMKLSLAEVIRIVVLLAAIIAAWYKLDSRLTMAEQRENDTQQLLQKVNGSVDQVQRYLSSRDPEYWWKAQTGGK